MRIRAFSAACALAGGMLALGVPSPGWAQSGLPDKLSVAAEVGPRAHPSTVDPRALGKFQEYQDGRAGQQTSALLEQLLLKYTPADSFGVYSLSARKLFDLDQSVRLTAKRPGSYDFQVRWDRIPHTYSTTARSPGVEDVAGFNTLPALRPDSIAWRNAPYIGAIRSQWDPVKVALGLTPTDKLDFKTEYTRIGKKGGIPLSMSYSGSSGPQREFVAPIDQTMHDFRLSQGYVSGDRSTSSALAFLKSYQVTVTYDYSKFNNGVTSTMVDNPQLSVSSPTNGVASARASLAPNNSAQAGTITGAVLLPLRTRITGSLRESWQSQNDPFFPQTSNDSLRSNPNYGLLTLARPSLNGKARTATLNLTANSHPMKNLTLAGRYRTYDYSNSTPQFHIRAMAVSDRSIALGDSLYSELDPFTKTNSDFSANYLLARGLSLTGGYATEIWKRDAEVRNVGKTTENTPRVSLDFNGIEWFSLRASYAQGKRRGGDYTQAATEIINFRRFDQADRDRKRATVMASVTPVSQITIGFDYRLGDDNFPNSQYGTQSDKSTMAGFDIDWSPVDRFNIGGGYSQEKVDNILNSRYRTGAAGTVTYDNATYKWTNTNTDKNYTTFASVNANLIPDRLDLVGNMSIVDSHFWVYNVNPTAPSGGTATQNLAATVENWPEVTQRIVPMALALRYRYSPDWAFTLRYQAEKYSQTDFRTVAPVFTSTGLSTGPVVTSFTGDLPGTVGQVAGSNTGQYHFLGNNYHPYTANWITLLVTFHPSLLPFTVGRSTF